MHMCVGIRVYVCMHTCMCVYTYMRVYTRRCLAAAPTPRAVDGCTVCVCARGGVRAPGYAGGGGPGPTPAAAAPPPFPPSLLPLPPAAAAAPRHKKRLGQGRAGPRRHHDGDHQDPRYPAGLRQLQPHHQGPHPDVRSVPSRGLQGGGGEGGLFEGRSRGLPGAGAPGGRCPRHVVLKALRGEAEPHPRPPAVGCVSLRITGFPLCTHLVRPAA